MNKIKILISIIVITVSIVIIAPFIASPLLSKKLLSTLNKKYPKHEIRIEKIRWSLLTSKLQLENISIISKSSPASAKYLKGEISSIHLDGINYFKAIFQKDYEINKIIVSNGTFIGSYPFNEKEKSPMVSKGVIHIDNMLFDQINLSLKDSSTSQTISVTEAELNLRNLEILQNDTIDLFHQFDFKAKEFVSVSQDSMYTYQIKNIAYLDTLKILSVDTLLIDPNYEEYDFTSRYSLEKDRFLVVLSDLNLYHFSAPKYLSSSQLVSSFLSIGNFNLYAFRDKRKKDDVKRKPSFQEYIYNYPGFLKIDSVVVNDGNISYTEHAEKASKPGRVNFNKIKTSIYNLTNDTIYKKNDTLITIIAEALLMGVGKTNISIKAKLFDPNNTISVIGQLASFDVRNLNQILERNAFVYANSATIDNLDFNFIADNNKATGKIIMLYKGLDIAVKSKITNDTTAIKERFISLIANIGTYDSNPLPDEDVRVGIIDYERDPSKSVFNYSFKAIISGVKSTIIKQPKRKKTFIQKIFGDILDKKDKNKK